MTLKLAWRLVWSRHPGEGWHRAAVLITTILATVLTCALVSLALWSARESQRVYERTGVIAESPDDGLLVVPRHDEWRGHQFSLVWLDGEENTDLPLPPGLESLPPPGHAAVSRALARGISEDPRLADRYNVSSIIGDDGANGDELLAYLRPERGDVLPEEATVSVTRFGASPGTVGTLTLGLSSDDTEIRPLLIGAIGLIGLPSVALLAVGIATSSPVRESRLRVLRLLGAPTRRLVLLVAIESVLVAAPGVVVASLSWVAISRELQQIPIVGRGVVKGDLDLPLGAGIAISVALLVGVALLAVALLRLIDRSTLSRPHRKAVASAARSLPLVTGLAVAVAASGMSGRPGVLSMMVGILLMAIGLPLAMPPMMQSVSGHIATQLDSLTIGLAMRRLERDPRAAIRPIGGLASLIVVLPSVLVFLAVVQTDESDTEEGLSVAEVIARSAPAEARAEFSSSLRDFEVLGIREVGPEVEIVGHCPADLVQCGDDAWASPDRPSLAVLLGLPPEMITFDEDGRVSDPGVIRLVAISDDSIADAEDVRRSAMTTFVAPVVNTLNADGAPAQLEAWVLSAITVGIVIIAIALIVGAVDRFVADRTLKDLLLILGVSSSRIARMESAIFGVVYVCAGASAFALGLVGSWLFLRLDPLVAYPAKSVVWLMACTSILGAVSALLVGGLTRAATDRRSPDPPGTLRSE